MFPVEMRRPSQRYEELTTICVWPIVGHTEQALPRVSQKRLFVLELAPHISMLRPSVDGFAACAIVLSKVTALNDEVGNDPMEGASLVVQRFARRSAHTLLTGAEGPKILRGQRHQIRIQLNGHPSQRFSAEGQIEVYRRAAILYLPHWWRWQDARRQLCLNRRTGSGRRAVLALQLLEQIILPALVGLQRLVNHR
jgi:hypothetical protein